MGFFESLGVEEYDRQYEDRLLVRRIARYFKPYRRRMIFIGVMLALLSVSGALLPIAVSRSVDLLPGSALGKLDGRILLLVGVILAAGLFDWGGNWLRRRLTARVIGGVMMDLRVDAFHSSIQHDLAFFDRFSSGRIVSRITSDTREFGQIVVLITDLVTEVCQALRLTVFLFSIEWKLALLLLAFLPPLYFVARIYRNFARRVTQQGMRAMGNVNAAIKETVSGIAIAKNFRQEASIYAEFEAANRMSYRVNLKRGLVLAGVYPTVNALSGMAMGAIVIAGGAQALGGVISAGSLYLFLMSVDRFWAPVVEITGFWAQIQSGLACAERVFALIDAESEVKQSASQPAPARERGVSVDFQGVAFQYGRAEKVLSDFDLHIAPGENLALVGHTGAGKSSIAKLIARFYEFQAGQILIDGVDIRNLELSQYRRQLGIVSQMPFLFSGTVLENILYASPGASAAQVLAAAEKIGGGEWLEALPQGLYSEVGERGGRLSIGQRQLVALLRVLVQRPAIFVLDEATASIDPFTEWQIQQAIEMNLKQSTSILIAHRLSTVKAADRIVVLENGRIIEEGDHRQLLRRGGHYASLYNTYFRHQSLQAQDRPDGL